MASKHVTDVHLPEPSKPVRRLKEALGQKLISCSSLGDDSLALNFDNCVVILFSDSDETSSFREITNLDGIGLLGTHGFNLLVEVGTLTITQLNDWLEAKAKAQDAFRQIAELEQYKKLKEKYGDK